MQQLQIDNCESSCIEKRNICQSECQEWFEQRKYRIRSSNAQKVLISQKKKKIEILTENLFVKNKKCSNITQEVLSHEKIRAYCKENLY